VLKRGGWLFALVVSVCLAFSALYELLEWTVSAFTGSAGDAFLGTQGDVFDTQKDMAMAMVGSITALLLLSKTHDRQLRGLLGQDDSNGEDKQLRRRSSH
jgi:putative membrane protein